MTAPYRLSAAQDALRARRLADEVIAPRAAEVDRTEAYPWENIRALTESGFMGLTVPAAYGGPGLGYLDAVVVIEEMARACGVTGRIVVEANMGALGAIMAYGSDTQKRLAAGLADVTDRMLDMAGVDRGMRVLDLACGAGSQSLRAAARVGPEGCVVACYISPTMLKHVQERGIGARSAISRPSNARPRTSRQRERRSTRPCAVLA